MKLDVDLPKDSILIVAAEASSCMYAKKFMQAWREHNPHVHFFGVGDREMHAMGMDCIGYAEDLAVVGLQEVLSHWKEIKQCFLSIEQKSKQLRPRFALLLDYPGFNLRMAKRLKQVDIPVVYYISPQLWAWKKGRVKQVKKYVDDMMVVFPFEVDFYAEYGIKAHFIGHPLLEVIDQEVAASNEPFQSEQITLGLMPGSRKSELRYNFLLQLESARLMRQKYNLKVQVLVAPTLDLDFVKSLVPQDFRDLEFCQQKPSLMIQGCDFILTASGTATLQVALLSRPMVVMYRMHPLTAFLAKWLVNSVEFFCIVNLIAGRRLVPELFQEQAHPQALLQELSRYLDDISYREKTIQDLRTLRARLGQGGATQNLVNYLRDKYAE
jgi:lipid-A-disaccharide synthase